MRVSGRAWAVRLARATLIVQVISMVAAGPTQAAAAAHVPGRASKVPPAATPVDPIGNAGSPVRAQLPPPIQHLLEAGLATAEALLLQAKHRQEQARSGQGGLGARPEDIAAAEAAVAVAKAELRLQQPFPDVRLYQGPVDLAQGAVRAAEKLKDACGETELSTKIEFNDEELDTKLETTFNCPDDFRDALKAAIDVAKSGQTIAELNLKLHTKPAPTIQNVLAPYQQKVKQAELRVTKLKSGGTLDQTTLDLNVARAQADVDTLRGMLEGSPEKTLLPQLTLAQAELKESQFRVDQAKAGQGGLGVRPEDIAIAESEVVTAKANLAALLNPLTEDVDKARAAVDGGQAAVQAANEAVDACGELEGTVRLKENDDGDVSFSEFVRDRPRIALEQLRPRERLHERFADRVEELTEAARQRLADRRPPDFEIVIPGLPPIVIDFLRQRLLERLQQRIEAILERLKAAIEVRRERIRGRVDEFRERIVRTRELIAATKEALEDLEVKMNFRCSGDEKDALRAGVDRAEALLTIAEQKLKLLTNPGPQILHFVIPLQQAVVAAEANLKKLKAGGDRDQATLELNVARAQANVDSLEAVARSAIPDFYRAQLRGAQAGLVEAQYRIQQARSGEGGIGARPEDIAIAEADLETAKQKLQQIIDPLPELIQIARSGVDAANAEVVQAKKKRDGCNHPVAILTTKIDDNDNDGEADEEAPEKTFTDEKCSDDRKDALNFAVDKARDDQVVAEQTLKKLTDPSEKFIGYLVGPASEAIVAAKAKLQKLKTGGSEDQATLERNLAVARADVDFWQAALDGSPSRQLQAQLAAAQADLHEAELREQQARRGLGGADARPEDIVIAQAELATAQIKLTQILNPPPEDVLSAQARVSAALANVDEARKLRDSCDDTTFVSVKKENENDNNPPERRDSSLTCPGHIKKAKEAEVDVARAELEVAEQEFQLLTNPEPPQIEYVITPYQQAVVAAEANVQKLKTGGSRDQATLELNIALAQSEVDRLTAALAGSQPGELRARVAGAQALLANAQYRQAQAANGQGGVDARSEDIIIAQAEAATAQAYFMALTNPLQEKVAIAQAKLDGAEANVEVAENEADACGKLKIIGVNKVNGKSGDRRTVTDTNCTDAHQDSLNWATDKARLERDIASQQLQILTDPAPPQIGYVIAPLFKVAEAAATRVQKLKTGGSEDQAALELHVAVAQANLERRQAALDGAPVRAAAAQLTSAQAILRDAEARQAQALAGQGGPHVRAEDIAIAEDLLVAQGARVQQLVDPLQELVQIANLAVQVNHASAREAHFNAKACGDLHLNTENQEGNDNDGDPKEEPLKLRTDVNCPDDQRDALDALAKGIKEFGLVPAAILSDLTDLETNEMLQTKVAQRKAEAAIVQFELQKLKTGGRDDESRLQLNVSLAQGLVQCRRAVVEIVEQGIPLAQPPPFAWSDPDPCNLAQLPGKIPPFMQQEVRLTAGAP